MITLKIETFTEWGERVLVEVAERRHGDHGRLVGQHLVHDPLDGAFDLPDVDGLADAHVAQDFLGDLHRLGIRPLRRGEGRLVFLRLLDIRGRTDGDVLDGSLGKALSEDHVRFFLRRRPEEHGDEWRPFGAPHAMDDFDGADSVTGQGTGEGAESGEIRKVQTEARLVEEEEVADHPDFGRTLDLDDTLHKLVQLGQGLLHGLVLDRIELERALCPEQRGEELATQLLVVE